MSTEQARDATNSGFSRHPVRIDPRWNLGFSLQRLALSVVPPIALGSVLMWLGQGIAALVVFSAFAACTWPLPSQCKASQSGLEVSWLCVTAYLGWPELEGAALVQDDRRDVIGPRRSRLLISRRDGRKFFIDAPYSILESLQSQLEEPSVRV